MQRVNTAGFYFLLIALMSLSISLMGLFWNGAILGKYMPFITMVFFFGIVANSVRASSRILQLNTQQNPVTILPMVKEVAEKIRRHSEALGGISRITIQMDSAALTHVQLMQAIGLLGQQVKPLVNGVN